jgi:hypothetical protein
MSVPHYNDLVSLRTALEPVDHTLWIRLPASVFFPAPLTPIRATIFAVLVAIVDLCHIQSDNGL